MPIELDPVRELRLARDRVALEAFSLSGVVKALTGALPSILRGFSSAPQVLELPKLPLKKDQKKFLHAIASLPYTDAMELRAWRPEGVKVMYLEYLDVLSPIAQHLRTLQKDVVQPYMAFLAQVVSDKNASLATSSQAGAYDKLTQAREKSTQLLAALYANDSHESQCKVKDVVARNQDWPAVFAQCNDTLAHLQSVDLAQLKLMLRQSVDYLGIIFELLQAGKLEATTPEVAQRLSNGAYCVAQELEFFSATYYRALALSGCLDNTVTHITASIG